MALAQRAERLLVRHAPEVQPLGAPHTVRAPGRAPLAERRPRLPLRRGDRLQLRAAGVRARLGDLPARDEERPDSGLRVAAGDGPAAGAPLDAPGHTHRDRAGQIPRVAQTVVAEPVGASSRGLSHRRSCSYTAGWLRSWKWLIPPTWQPLSTSNGIRRRGPLPEALANWTSRSPTTRAAGWSGSRVSVAPTK